MSDNCDHNFGTFDDFGVNDQRVSHNMILMSKYKGQHGGKKGKKIRARPSPPLFGQCPKKNVSFYKTGVELRFWPVQARILTKARKRLSRQNLTKKCVNSQKIDKKVRKSPKNQNFNKSALTSVATKFDKKVRKYPKI